MLKRVFCRKMHWKLFHSYPRRFASTLQSQPDDNDNKSLWIESPFPAIEPLLGVTLPELLWSRLPLIDNDRVAFENICGRRYTYKDVYRYSRGFAAALKHAGFKRGDIIAIILPNCPEYPIIAMGAIEVGVVITAANCGAMPYEIKGHLEKSGCVAVVTIGVPSILETVRQVGAIKHIIVIGDSHDGCHTFSEMIKTDPTGTEFLKGSEIDVKDAVVKISYSSGTSGLPKGVLLTHHNLISNLLQINHKDVRAWKSAEEGGNERFVGILPFFHSYAFLVSLVSAMYQGAHCLTLPKLENRTFLHAMRNHKPTFLHLSPSLISYIIKSSDIGTTEMQYVKGITSGASAMQKKNIHELLEKVGHHIVYQEGYGMTEMSPVALLLFPFFKNSKLGSVGLPLPGTVAKVVSILDEKTVGPNQTGELWLKGPQMMKGYKDNLDETNKAIDPDGWLHTGDLAYYDDDKCLYIADRLKELIKSKGLQVSPLELENLLREHEGIDNAAVIGIPDERSQEVARAYIIRSNPNLSAQEVHNFINKKLIPYKRLKGGIKFIETFPQNATGKILKRKLKENFLNGSEK